MLENEHSNVTLTVTWEWWCVCDRWFVWPLLCKRIPGWGAGRLCWRAGAVGGISCDFWRNHGSPVFAEDGCEKPRWCPTTTAWWPVVCKLNAWLFITPTEPVEFLRRKNLFRYFRSNCGGCFTTESTSILNSNKNKTEKKKRNKRWEIEAGGRYDSCIN